MEKIISKLEKIATSNLDTKAPPDYLALRNGKLNMRADFVNSADYTHTLPALVLNDNTPISSLASSAAPISYNFTELMELEAVSPEQRICDHLTEVALESASLRLFKNSKGELREIENKLTQIVEDDRMDIHSFSQNTLTNCSAYNILG